MRARMFLYHLALFLTCAVCMSQDSQEIVLRRLKEAQIGSSLAELDKALDDQKRISIHEDIIFYMVKLHSTIAVDHLLKKFSDSRKVHLKIFLARALKEDDPQKGEALLLQLLEPSLPLSIQFRLVAASDLTLYGNSSGYKWLVEAYKSKDPQVLGSLAGQLGSFWSLAQPKEGEPTPSQIFSALLTQNQKSINLNLAFTLNALAKTHPNDPLILPALDQLRKVADDDFTKDWLSRIYKRVQKNRCKASQAVGDTCLQ